MCRWQGSGWSINVPAEERRQGERREKASFKGLKKARVCNTTSVHMVAFNPPRWSRFVWTAVKYLIFAHNWRSGLVKSSYLLVYGLNSWRSLCNINTLAFNSLRMTANWDYCRFEINQLKLRDNCSLSPRAVICILFFFVSFSPWELDVLWILVEDINTACTHFYSMRCREKSCKPRFILTSSPEGCRVFLCGLCAICRWVAVVQSQSWLNAHRMKDMFRQKVTQVDVRQMF